MVGIARLVWTIPQGTEGFVLSRRLVFSFGIPRMPSKRKSVVIPVPKRTLEELLKVSKRLADQAAKAGRELNDIAAEMEATRLLIEQRMKEDRRTVN